MSAVIVLLNSDFTMVLLYAEVDQHASDIGMFVAELYEKSRILRLV